ncbi:alpha/beta hydrolase [uncultured Salinisphaera sp.]|uniref:alpha/beta fold hydrolase n=1 Tax=uncultured Salinisphaera sp. TaxID=359372 RepID=UPI0032B30CC3
MSKSLATGVTPRRALPPEQSALRRKTRVQIDWLDVDGVRLRYGIRRGKGRPMVLLGTLGTHLDMLLPLVNALDDIEVIIPEMPGTGASPSRGLPHGMGWHARLLQTFLTRLGYDSAINLVGAGWGASLAQTYALAGNARVNRLVLAASTVGIGLNAVNGQSLRRFNAVRRFHAEQATPDGLSGLYNGLIRQRPQALKSREQLAAPELRGYIHQLVARVGWTTVHRLHNLMCPTLIMAGDADQIAPIYQSRLLHWLIPKSHVHVVRGGGHLFLQLRANECAAVIQRFINERRYDGTDNADYFTLRGLPADGHIVPPGPPAERP